MLSRNTIILSGILLISAFMHLQHFPKELVSIHTWRQTQTQSNINNFYEEDMNILNPRRNDRGDTDGIFQMEFPLMQWLVAIQYKVFGNHLIISRLFMFLTGCFSVLGIWVLLEALFQKHYLSMMGAWAFTFSPNFYYYMINPMPDNLALCCGIWGLAFFFRWHNDQKWIDLLLSGLFFSISSLCKLPFIIYFVVPLAYFVQKIQKDGITRLTTWQILAAGSPVILPVAWYITVIPHWGSNMVVKGMLDNKEGVSRLIEYYQHILISTLPELLLNYGSVLFFLAGFYFLIKRKSYRDSRFILMLCLGLLALLYYFFEANAIAKIHDYYLFPFFPLLFILVAFGAYYLFNLEKKFCRYSALLLLAALPFICYARMHTRWNTESPGFNRDLLMHKKELREAVPKQSLVVAGNDDSHYIFFYYIDKKGWGFGNNNLTPEDLRMMIGKGAEYLYTDSEEIIRNPGIQKLIDHHVLEAGSVNVYKLNRSDFGQESP